MTCKLVYFIINDKKSQMSYYSYCMYEQVPLTAFGAATGADLTDSTGTVVDFLSSDESTLALCNNARVFIFALLRYNVYYFFIHIKGRKKQKIIIKSAKHQNKNKIIDKVIKLRSTLQEKECKHLQEKIIARYTECNSDGNGILPLIRYIVLGGGWVVTVYSKHTAVQSRMK